MTQPVATCPNCGAKVIFRWSSSVQTVCEYCKSILVRTDLDLRKVGQVADIPPDSSPLQMNAEGVYRNKAFVIIGRISYQYPQGAWNEWHIMMNDGANAWLSDAQAEYAISFLRVGEQLPLGSELQVGRQCTWKNQIYTLTVITTARYRGVEGEWPFQSWDKKEAKFADFRNENG